MSLLIEASRTSERGRTARARRGIAAEPMPWRGAASTPTSTGLQDLSDHNRATVSAVRSSRPSGSIWWCVGREGSAQRLVRRAGRSTTGRGPISQRCVALAEREVGPRSRDRRGGSATSGVARPSFAPARAHHYGTTGERHCAHPGCHSCHLEQPASCQTLLRKLLTALAGAPPAIRGSQRIACRFTMMEIFGRTGHLRIVTSATILSIH